jgi:hypothetical protein
MVGSTYISMKIEKIPVIVGFTNMNIFYFTNIEHILTNQSFPYYLHCMERRALDSTGAAEERAPGTAVKLLVAVPGTLSSAPAVEPRMV